MHEASLVKSLLRQVETLLAEHGGTSVEAVRVELGPLSGVEPLLVESAFRDLAPQSACRDARLEMDEVPLEARCETCGQEFEIERFRFVCPRCEGSRVRVVRGDEFRLVDVTLGCS